MTTIDAAVEAPGTKADACERDAGGVLTLVALGAIPTAAAILVALIAELVTRI